MTDGNPVDLSRMSDADIISLREQLEAELASVLAEMARRGRSLFREFEQLAVRLLWNRAPTGKERKPS